MKRVALNLLILIVVTFGLSLAICGSAAAADTIYYFKLDGAYQDIDSDDFDGGGGTFASNESVAALTPDIDSGGYGYGFTFGGIIGHWGGEIYFRQTKHEGSYNVPFGSRNGDIDFYEIGGNIKYYFVEFDKSVFNGYVLAGLAYTRLDVEHGGRLVTGEESEAMFKGKTYNLGLGGTCRFGDHFGLEAQYLYGFNHIMTVHAYGQKANRFPDLESQIQTFNFGAFYSF